MTYQGVYRSTMTGIVLGYVLAVLAAQVVLYFENAL